MAVHTGDNNGELSPMQSGLNSNMTAVKNYFPPITLIESTPASIEANNSNVTVTEYFDLAQTIIFGTWLSISMILAVFGNLMVITVVWRHRGMRTRTNMFLVNLAVADFLVGILMAPFSLTTLIKEKWIFGEYLCFINSFCNALFFMTSIHTLMYISIHKYLSIVRPLTRITKCKIMIMITAAWTWAAICGALTTFILSHAVYKKGTMQCGPEYPAYTPKALIFHIIIQLTNIVLPLSIMLFAYFRMFREIKEHMQRLDENTAMDRAQIYQQQRTVTITLFIVLACFFLCWIPYCIYANYVTFEPDKSKIPGYANAMAYCFGYMNSACNPIIYAWRSPSFREGYKEILCQEPSYVVSDAKFEFMYNQAIRSMKSKDTLHDSSSGPLGRFSIFLNSVKMQPNQSSRRGSEVSQISARISRASTASNVSSHKILRKLTSKTAKGSSIIRRDDSIILVKNGKVVSVREDSAFKKSNSDDVFLPSPGGQSKLGSSVNSSKHSSLNVLHESKSEYSSQVQNGHISQDDPECNEKGVNSPLLNEGTVQYSLGKRANIIDNSSRNNNLDRQFKKRTNPNQNKNIDISLSKIITDATSSDVENMADVEDSDFTYAEEKAALLGQKENLKRTRSESVISPKNFTFDFFDDRTHAKSLGDIYNLPLFRTPSHEHLDTDISSQLSHSDHLDIDLSIQHTTSDHLKK